MSSGGKGGKAPKAPDYSALAQQQADLNKQAANEQTAANRPNQYDAFGNSITWKRSVDQNALSQAQSAYDAFMGSDRAYQGGAGVVEEGQRLKAALDQAAAGTNWEQHQTLSPEIKAIWDKYIGDSGQAMGKYGDVLNQFMSNYQTPGNLPKYSGDNQLDQYSGNTQLDQYDPTSMDKSVSDALYGSIMDRGRVEQSRESDALNTRLRQQGLVPGSEAYNRAMQNLMTSQNDANLLAAQQATLAGQDESRKQYLTRLQGQQAQGSEGRNDYLTRLQGQTAKGNEGRAEYAARLNSELTSRNQPLQELAGLAGIAGGQPYSPTYPGFSGSTGYNPADLVGAAQAQYASKMNASNASNSKKSGLLGAGASLGGSFLGSK